MSVKVCNIDKYYGAQKALDNVSFEIKTGEIVGFLGPNGAGKSTMMKIITGFIPATNGTVDVNGIDINSDIIAVKSCIGYLPENNPLYLNMYVKEYLAYAARYYLKDSEITKRVELVVEQTGLEQEQHKQIGQLSKGYRQRVGLAQALIHNPSVLILDEPTTGLDPNQIVEIRNLISRIGEQKTILLSTHIMQEVEAICNKVIIINSGKIVANSSTSEIKQTTDTKLFTVIVEFDKQIDITILQKIKNVKKVSHITGNSWVLQSDLSVDIRSDIFNFAVKNQFTVLSMNKAEKSLEEVFQELTSKQ